MVCTQPLACNDEDIGFDIDIDLGGNGDTDLLDGGGRHSNREDGAMGKITHSKSKDKKNHLQIYARQFGLNDRGCYVALGLAALAFL